MKRSFAKMSCDDLLEKFDDLAKRFKTEFNEIIENERAKMKAEVEAYNAEKEQMQAVNISEDDIIHLSIGGQKFSTTRSTLCQVEGSLLATMFSGRWEDNLKRDENGAIFFDFNPKHFGLIMEYLRVKKITSSGNSPTLPEVSEDEVNNFNTLVEYLGLSDEIAVTTREAKAALASEKFDQPTSGISVEDHRTLAIHSPNRGYENVVGQNIYQEGIVGFKLKLESLKNNNWVFVGVLKRGYTLQRANNIDLGWPNSYGWVLGNTGYVCKEGLFTVDAMSQ